MTNISILSPSILSPSAELHVHLHAENSCNNCCPTASRRMVPKDEKNLVPDTTSKVVLWLVKHCCFCLPVINPSEQNKQAARMYDSYLKQQYGELTAKTALRRAGVDLASKEETGAPFLETEASAIIEKAEAIQDRMDSLKQIVKHLAYYNEKTKLDKSTSREIEVEPKSEKRSPSPQELDDIVIQIAVQ
ncbi:MAG: hypothetical protein HYX67_08385, partial [Candidatus Melainabacteria bacterium]|nr:hypothetical protein [Candidatus Melainabacteria bacterium]